ncbi:MAG: DNA-binding protein [Alphaproteobacteria bacterium]|nr:MAG: DNA-binding protein [Alphaproteobacteria bacterium]
MAGLFRQHSGAERLADGIVHAVGILASLVGVAVLLAVALPRLNAASGTGLAIYGVTLIGMFSASAAYNLVPNWKPALRRLDQAAIFMKIAGTYTPLVIVISGLFAYAVLAAVWVAALAGGLVKLALGPRFDRLTVPFYLTLGWASLLLAWPIFATLPLSAALLLVAGGLLYSVGVVFHLWDRLAFQNAIWHGFVLAAAACHFTAISVASLSAV